MENLNELAQAVGGTIDEVGILPDGSGFATMSMPLPKDHWSLVNPGDFNIPPMLMRMPASAARDRAVEAVRAAVRYGYRASTMNGTEPDLDPDALVSNVIVGLLGVFTSDGLSVDSPSNPDPVPVETAVAWLDAPRASDAPASVVDQAARDMYDEVNTTRRMLKDVGAGLQAMRDDPNLRSMNGEVGANITIAFRKVEDASMRCGKALQALDGGVSVYDRSTTVGA